MKKLFQVIETIASEIDEAVVFFSTGKDSLVTLDLCHKFLKKIHVIHLYFVPNLEYRKKYFDFIKNKYQIEIDCYPSHYLSKILPKYNPTLKIPLIKFIDQENDLRKKYDCRFLAYGYRKQESLMRRAQLGKCGGIEREYGRFFPIADWTAKHVLEYLTKNKIPLAPEYEFPQLRDMNFPGPHHLYWMRENHPKDFKKTMRLFPFLEQEIFKYETDRKIFY